MKIANIYNHLNGMEFIQVHKPALWNEIVTAINSIDASLFTKVSKDKQRAGKVLYDQVAINKEFEKLLNPFGWNELKTFYYVTDNLNVEKEVIKEKDNAKQQADIIAKGATPFRTNNQVDFVKERIAIEVQFGKYFSVAYDLHVKHTFFYLMDDIDVGIEIIPTHNMMRKMDTGVAWFENEVANVMREGRSNPTVPIVIIGIETDPITI